MTHFKAKSVAEYAMKKHEASLPFRQPIWACTVKIAIAPNAGEVLYVNSQPTYIETERWFDARAFAIKILGVVEVECVQVGEDRRPFPRYQLCWIGTAASGTTNPLRQMKRFLANPLRENKAAWEAVDG